MAINPNREPYTMELLTKDWARRGAKASHKNVRPKRRPNRRAPVRKISFERVELGLEGTLNWDKFDEPGKAFRYQRWMCPKP